MKILAALLLILLSLGSYFLLALRFAVYQRYPVVQYLLAAVGVAYLVWLAADQFSIGRLVAAVAGAALLGGFLWYTLSYSAYRKGPAQATAGLGSRLASITLATADGEEIPFPQLLTGHPLNLVIFYRGWW